MATNTRQLGRQNTNGRVSLNLPNRTSNDSTRGASSPEATSTQRRYVLDVPRTRRNRSSRTASATTDATVQEVEMNNSSGRAFTSTTDFQTMSPEDYDASLQDLYRSTSRQYRLQDDYLQTREFLDSRSYDDATIRKLIESGVSHVNSTNEDQEVQRLTSQSMPDVKNYPINVDNNPDVIVRPNTQRITYKQDISVRYLKPDSPTPPGPIIIREIRAPAPPPAPPIILRQRPPAPRTPSPIIIREKPPSRPKSVPTKVIKKIIPPPPPPPRQIIIERMPKLPPKPRPVIIERWLPYQQAKRKIIHEKAKPLDPPARVRNKIIEWRSPEVELVKQVRKLGVQKFDPQSYYSQHGDQLYATEFIQRKLSELGLHEELALMQEQQSAAVQERIRLEQVDEQSLRQILNGSAAASTQQRYGTTSNINPIVRLVRSSSNSGLIDQYDEEKLVYDQSTENSNDLIYHKSSLNIDRSSLGSPVVTEEMLLKARETNGGKFPGDLLTKLGSQVYYVPSEQVELTTNNIKSRSNNRYYVVNRAETGYESTGDEFNDRPEVYQQENFVELNASDLEKLATNYDLYSSSREKLQGEQAAF